MWFFVLGVNREFLVCDAYLLNTTLFAVVCACGATMCGMDCVGVAV